MSRAVRHKPLTRAPQPPAPAPLDDRTAHTAHQAVEDMPLGNLLPRLVQPRQVRQRAANHLVNHPVVRRVDPASGTSVGRRHACQLASTCRLPPRANHRPTAPVVEVAHPNHRLGVLQPGAHQLPRQNRHLTRRRRPRRRPRRRRRRKVLLRPERRRRRALAGRGRRRRGRAAEAAGAGHAAEALRGRRAAHAATFGAIITTWRQGAKQCE